MKKSIRPVPLLLALLMIMSLPGCRNAETGGMTQQEETEALSRSETTATEPAVTEAPTEEPTTEEATEAPITISLVSIGDMLMHSPVSWKAEAENWDYSYVYEHVKDKVEAADLAIVNNEVIIGGNEKGNQNYPCFNVRTELGDCEVATGFDVMLSASNHTMDQGIDSLLYCANFWEENYPDITVVGIHSTEEDAKEIEVRDVNGIKIALLNYTYGLNGYSLPEGYEWACDLMTDETKDKIADDIARAKELSDFVIVFPHWGEEYVLTQNAEQEAWAMFFAEQGVDLVIGTHPHVLEPVEWITAENGNRMLCYYSLGNFISTQPYFYTMLGGMSEVSITKDATGTYISDYAIKLTVTHYSMSCLDITTYFVEDYTDELAAGHYWSYGVDDWHNDGISFTVEGLKQLGESICPGIVDYD